MTRFSSLVLAMLLAALPLRAAHSAEFVLVNKSGRSIDAFYMAPCWARNWGNNQVAWTPVWTSKTFTIKDIEPGCYNLMIVLPFGNKCVISGELVEGVKAWTITPWTLVRAATDDCSHIAHPVSAGERSHDRRDFIPMPALQ